MPVTIQWDDEAKTTALIEYRGGWTWDELYEMVRKSRQMLDSVDYKVDIIQLWKGARIPSNGLSHARNLIANNHPHTGTMVMVGAGPLFLSLWRILEKLYSAFIAHQKIYFAETVDEAREILQQHRKKTA